jgi:hypothetical protein
MQIRKISAQRSERLKVEEKILERPERTSLYVRIAKGFLTMDLSHAVVVQRSLRCVQRCRGCIEDK